MNNRQSIIPPWLSNPHIPAPCPCGQPMTDEEPCVMVESESGMTRWVHYSCFQQAMMGHGHDEDEF